MMLPTMEGTGVLRQLKQDPVTKSIPVIILSGLSQKNETKLKRAGASAYFQKSLHEPGQRRQRAVTGASTIARDISARKSAEEQLKLQSAALEAAANAIAITVYEGKIVWVNRKDTTSASP
jgi:sigma-B regulation protein RsbU (phosphoserine phosphatase)